MKIFDGYNVIGAGGRLNLDLGQDDKEERLLRILAKYRSRRRSRESFLVIFDGHHGRLAERGRKERHAGIDVEWAVGESADSLIVRKVRHSGNPRGVEVISSDREVLRTIGDLRARGLRSTDFVARALRVLGEETGVEKPGAPSPEEIREWLDLFGTGGESER